MKTVVLYASYKHFDCTEYFFNNAYQNNENVDFYLIDSLNTLESHIVLDKIVADKKNNSNLKIFRRQNKSLDFGAWADTLASHNLIGTYDYYIFINDTCTGPFFPVGINIDWIELFQKRITTDVKLVGPNINYQGGGTYPHVQSFMFIVDNVGLQIAIKNDILSTNIIKKYESVDLSIKNNKFDFVDANEIGLSNAILDAGYNIGCFMKCISGIDFRLQRFTGYIHRPDGAMYEHVIYFPNIYFKTNPSPFETIFSKVPASNVGLIAEKIMRNTESKYIDQIYSVILLNDDPDKYVTLKLSKFDWVELDSDTYFIYGTNQKNTEVTDKIKRNAYSYVIQPGTEFNKQFTDIVPYMPKNLYIKINGQRYIIPESVTKKEIEIKF